MKVLKLTNTERLEMAVLTQSGQDLAPLINKINAIKVPLDTAYAAQAVTINAHSIGFTTPTAGVLFDATVDETVSTPIGDMASILRWMDSLELPDLANDSDEEVQAHLDNYQLLLDLHLTLDSRFTLP